MATDPENREKWQGSQLLGGQISPSEN